MIASIIRKRLESFDSEVMKGLHREHLAVIRQLIQKELGFSFIGLNVHPTDLKIVICVYDSNQNKLYVKENAKMRSYMDALSIFFQIPDWKIEFEKRPETEDHG